MYASLPLSPRRLGTSRPKAKRLTVFSRCYAPKNTIRLPPSSGEADTKEKGNYIFYYFYIRIYVYLLPDSYRSRWSGMASHCILASLRS